MLHAESSYTCTINCIANAATLWLLRCILVAIARRQGLSTPKTETAPEQMQYERSILLCCCDLPQKTGSPSHHVTPDRLLPRSLRLGLGPTLEGCGGDPLVRPSSWSVVGVMRGWLSRPHVDSWLCSSCCPVHHFPRQRFSRHEPEVSTADCAGTAEAMGPFL